MVPYCIWLLRSRRLLRTSAGAGEPRVVIDGLGGPIGRMAGNVDKANGWCCHRVVLLIQAI
jgi:hypothetical protein